MTLLHQPRWTGCDAEIVLPPHRADVIEDVMGDEAILFDPLTGSTHRLNETALLVWRLCDGETTTRQIAQHLTDAYDVGFNTALDHIEQILVVLTDARLLTSEPIRWS